LGNLDIPSVSKPDIGQNYKNSTKVVQNSDQDQLGYTKCQQHFTIKYAAVTTFIIMTHYRVNESAVSY